MTAAPVTTRADRLTVRSRFAETDVDPHDVISFPDGVPGYESAHDFVLIDVPDQPPLKVLQAVSDQEPCFLVVDPKMVMPGYRCELGASDRLRLGATDDSALLWLAVVSVAEGGEIAVNLRAPIVINPARMRGRQVMPNSCVYPLRHLVG
jgi:flagellar assembly factor FliW